MTKKIFFDEMGQPEVQKRSNPFKNFLIEILKIQILETFNV